MGGYNTQRKVAAALVAASRGGRTIICSVSTPTTPAYDSFDLSLIIGNGLQLYFGSAKDSISYFENIGFTKTSNFQSPVEFLIEIASDR